MEQGIVDAPQVEEFGRPSPNLPPPKSLKETFKLKEPPLELDAITYEILKHRLWYVTLSVGETLKKVSGTTVVVEGNDFSVYLTDDDGAPVFLGPYVMMHSGIADLLIANTLEFNSGDPGINDGDMFFSNDPWGGPIHQCDCAIACPIFVEDELFAWTGVTLHQIDMGGVQIGGLCPSARDCYAEPSIYPFIKIMDRGAFRSDIDRLIRRNSRLPGIVALDIRSMIGANEKAREDLLELVDRYGKDVVKSAMIMIQNKTSEAFKKRLSGLPKGKIRGRDFMEIGGSAPELQDEIYEAQVTMTNTGEKLIFDFSGTSEQSSGFVNCAIGGLRSGTLTSLVEALAWDLPWNAGLLANMEIVTQEGTVNNATHPAAVSDGIQEAAIITLSAAVRPVALLCMMDDELREFSYCTSGGCYLGNTMGGLDEKGDIWGTLLMDTVSGLAYGGNAGKDGVDLAGTAGLPYSLMANVETNEFHYPLLYLFRRMSSDCGGAGFHRGGNSIELCLTLHDTAYMLLLLWTHGFEFPNAIGGSGGLPGSSAISRLALATNIEERFASGEVPQDIEELDPQPLNAKSESHLGVGSVLFLSSGSAAGYGDPMKRDPDAVLRDVELGHVSVDAALNFYGVVVSEGPPRVDREATEKERERIIEERLALGRKPADWGELVAADLKDDGWEEGAAGGPDPGEKAEGTVLLSVGMGLDVVRDAYGGISWACHDCSRRYCDVASNPKMEARIRVGRLTELGGPRSASVRLDTPRFFFRQFYCPGCGLMWDGEVARATDPIMHDIELDPEYLDSL